MRKHFYFLIFCLLFIGSAKALDLQSAGLRAGFGAEVSARFGWNGQRLETDLGAWGRGKACALTGVYQYTFDLDQITPGMKWFVGPGAQAMLGADLFNLGLVGQIGLDYYIPGVPFCVTADYRPCLFFGTGEGFDGGAFAFGFHYCF